jgi:uncharacterized membrane protein YphA (DoxX/SURF4 family)
MAPVRAVAHALLGSIFVVSGAQALLNPGRYARRAAPVTERLAPKLAEIDERIPNSTTSLIRINGAVQLGGGLLLTTSTAVRPAAALLAGSLIPATFIGHPFWSVKGRVAKQVEAVHFAKNLGLLGGLLLAAVDTQGKPGLAWRTKRAYRDTGRSIKRAAQTANREARLAIRAADAGRHIPS